MASPKPPLTCTVYGLGKGGPVRVVHDGDKGWYLAQDDGRAELRIGDERTVLVDDDGIERTDGAVYSFGWVKSMIHPTLLAYLDVADGEVEASERIGDRDTLVARVSGLRHEGGPPMRLWVDRGTGVILRIERVDDPAPLMVIEELRIGTVTTFP